MNGRIYDPLLGRFLSADIAIQAPGNLQSYNRYSYVMNNPLTLTDPSGFYSDWLTDFRKAWDRFTALFIGNSTNGGMGRVQSDGDGESKLATASFRAGVTNGTKVLEVSAAATTAAVKLTPGLNTGVAITQLGTGLNPLSPLGTPASRVDAAIDLGAQIGGPMAAEKASSFLGSLVKDLADDVKDVGSVVKAIDSGAVSNVTTPIGELKEAGLNDAHHVIQNAAVRDIPGYNRNLAPGVQLEGPPTTIGSQHYLATQAQRAAGGGTYGTEREVAASALRAAGFSEEKVQQALKEADTYFQSIGVDSSTATRIPGNRTQ
jgi:hypothetical protein